jgi:glycogen operon protein
VRAGDGERLNDIVWLHVDGTPMEASDWEADNKAIGMYLNGDGIAGLNARGQRIVDDHFVLYFNAAHEDAELTLPPEEYAAAWDVVLDTSGAATESTVHKPGSTLTLGDGSMIVLREHAEPEAEPDHSVAASLAAYAQVPEPTATGKKKAR